MIYSIWLQGSTRCICTKKKIYKSSKTASVVFYTKHRLKKYSVDSKYTKMLSKLVKVDL